jgi:serine/threonine protein kinase/WD40 repeat protein
MVDDDDNQDEVSEFERVADEFADQCARGEAPDIDDYVERFPQLETQIRDLFPMILGMHVAGGDSEPINEDVLRELGDFQLIREIGRGGMGVVYEAHQASLSRRVALKLLPSPALLPGRQRQRFELESRAAARLHHSNIVPVFGVGEHEGLQYYVMQLIDGCGLDEILKEIRRRKKHEASGASSEQSSESPFASAAASYLLSGSHTSQGSGTGVNSPSAKEDSPTAGSTSGIVRMADSAPSQRSRTTSSSGYHRSVVRLFVQLADALYYAHCQGVLHRDIKPSNLMLDSSGQIWVMDFGLAKSDESVELTRTGDVVGTLRYMAPERFRGESDPRSDLYSLGLTLYEMLLLRPAFESTNREKLLQELAKGTPPRPRRVDPRISRDLETILLKTIEPQPERRYANAAALRDDLQRFLDGRSIQAKRASFIDRTIKWVHREPVVAGLTMSFAVMVAVAIVGISKQWRDAVAARADAERNLADVTAAQRDLYRQLYVADMRLAQSAVEKDRSREAVDILSRHLPNGEREDLRQFFWHHMWKQCHQGEIVRRLPTSGRLLQSRTGDVLYVLETSRRLHFVDPRTFETQTVLDGAYVRMQLSPDGRYLAVRRGRMKENDNETVWLIDTASREVVTEVTVELSSVWSTAFSIDGKALLVCGTLRDPTNGRGQFIRWDIAERRETARFEVRDTVHDLACSPQDGSFVMWRPGLLEWRDPDSLEVRRSIPTKLSNPELEFTSDGSTLIVTGARQHDIQVVDAATGAIRHTLSGHTLEIYDVELIENDTQLLSSCKDSSIRLWDLRSGKHVHTFFGHLSSGVNLLSTSPHEFLTSAYDGEIRRWSTINLSRQTVPLSDPNSAIVALQWSKDGETLLVGQHHEIKRYHPATQSIETAVVLPGVFYSSLASAIAEQDNGSIFVGTTNLDRESPLTGAIHRWDAQQDETTLFALTTNAMRDMRLSPDERLLSGVPISFMTGPQTYTLTVLHAETGEPFFEINQPEPFCQVEFSADSRLLYVASSDWIKAIDTTSWKVIRTLNRPPDRDDMFTGLAVLSRPGTVLVAGNKGSLEVWEEAKPFPAMSLAGHEGFVDKLVVSPDGRQLFTHGHDRTVRIWDLETGTALATLSAMSDETPTGHFGLTLSPDGRRLAAMVGSTKVRIWTAATEEDVRRSINFD